MTRSWLVLLLVVPALAPGFACAAVTAEWVHGWRADLAVVADTLPEIHPNLFHSISRREFRRELDSLAARVPHLEHHQITVELARIVARVGDGHTRLTLPFDPAAGFFTGHASTAPPLVPGLLFHHLPVRLRLFADGLFVVRATEENRELLGGRVVEIGRLSIDQAMAAVAPTVQRDNDQQVRDLMPQWLVVPEILAARGVIEDPSRVRIAVERAQGGGEAAIEPLAPGSTLRWLEARDSGEPPLAERRPEDRHWFERIAGTPVVYARYREVYDDADETVAAFAEALFRALGRGGAERLILDLRGNVGGNGFLNRPILHGIIGSPELGRPGHLFVLVDRDTFSAAMMLLADLEKHTPAILVGEKSGGHPNSYGDSRRLRLPHTGLTVRVSTLFWQMTGPQDRRDGIIPHVKVKTRFADWQARRDPALDSTLSLVRTASDPAGEWTGQIGVGPERIPWAVSVRREGGGWSVRLDAPDLEAHAEPATQVRVARGDIAFVRRGPGPAMEFRGHIAPGAIVGVALFQGARLPFVLGRKRPAE